MNYSNKKEEVVDKSFKVILFAKVIFALGQTASGFLLLLFKPSQLQNLLYLLTQGELKEDPSDFIASHLIQLGTHISLSGQHIAAIYLLIHGLVKMVTLFLLYQKKLWSYPLSIVMFSGFIIFQLKEFLLNGHWILILLTVIDLFMIYLTWSEYHILKATHQ